MLIEINKAIFLNSKALKSKGLINNDVNAALNVNCLFRPQGLLPLLMQTTILVFCLMSELVPNPRQYKYTTLSLNSVSERSVAYIPPSLRHQWVLRSVL